MAEQFLNLTLIRVVLRELFGFFLVLVGLYAWMICLSFFDQTMIIEGVMLFFIGLVTFKGGLHLMKVGMAAHILLTDHKTEEKSQKGRKG
jgi:hypothetical protein